MSNTNNKLKKLKNIMKTSSKTKEKVQELIDK